MAEKEAKDKPASSLHQCTAKPTPPLPQSPAALMQPVAVPDLDDRMMRSAGRWSPLEARTTSPTATLNYPSAPARRVCWGVGWK